MGMGGNVTEWKEVVFNFCDFGPGACEFDDPLAPTDSSMRGGDWNSPATLMPRDSGIFPSTLRGGHFTLGFRVASVPEPNSLLLGLMGTLGLLLRRQRRTDSHPLG